MLRSDSGSYPQTGSQVAERQLSHGATEARRVPCTLAHLGGLRRYLADISRRVFNNTYVQASGFKATMSLWHRNNGWGVGWARL